MSCSHESRTATGCKLCELKELVRVRGAVGDGVSETYVACPHCRMLVRCVGMPITVYHEKPDCAASLADPLDVYVAKLHAQILAAGEA